jgi:hypothetical protein
VKRASALRQIERSNQVGALTLACGRQRVKVIQEKLPFQRQLPGILDRPSWTSSQTLYLFFGGTTLLPCAGAISGYAIAMTISQIVA